MDLPLRLQMQRIFPHLRPLRPPNAARFPPRPRFFNSRSPLFVVSRSPKRPTLPFLSPFESRNGILRARLISTDTKVWVKYYIWLFFFWSGIFWATMAVFKVGAFFLQQDWLDRLYPCPEDWHIVAKHKWRITKRQLETTNHGAGVMDWANVGTGFRDLIQSLEDWRFMWYAIPGGLQEQYEWDRTIPGLENEEEMLKLQRSVWYDSRIGYDITMKSKDWRRGYFEAYIWLAKAAEMRLGFLEHNGSLWPPNMVISEENPYPAPVPGEGTFTRPRIDDCEYPFDHPDQVYSRILTTKGFTPQQYMQAGIAYADWLSQSGRPEVAERLFKWSLDRACEGVSHPEMIVDNKKAVIRANAPFVTQNILNAITALATHYGRHERVSESIEMYLSVLRARRAAPQAPAKDQYPHKGPDYSLDNLDSIIRFALTLGYRKEPFPPPPPSGDEPFQRTQTVACDEAAIATWLGEILFAKSSQRKQGLEFTREAVEVSEQLYEDSRLNESERRKCTECLDLSYENWENMLVQLAKEQREQNAQDGDGVSKGNSSWFKWTKRKDPLLTELDWEQELKEIRKRSESYGEHKIDKLMTAVVRTHSKMFVV